MVSWHRRLDSTQYRSESTGIDLAITNCQASLVWSWLFPPLLACNIRNTTCQWLWWQWHFSPQNIISPLFPGQKCCCFSPLFLRVFLSATFSLLTDLMISFFPLLAFLLFDLNFTLDSSTFEKFLSLDSFLQTNFVLVLFLILSLKLDNFLSERIFDFWQFLWMKRLAF